MSKSGNKFKSTWKNQKEIGLIYGRSAVAVGKALIELGLRDAVTKSPTSLALSEGIAQSTPLRDGTQFYLWHKDLTCKALNSLDDWNRQSTDDRNAQESSLNYASLIKAALKADNDGEHHVIVDGYYDEAQDIAKNVRRRGSEFIAKVNAQIKDKIPSDYLIEL